MIPGSIPLKGCALNEIEELVGLAQDLRRWAAQGDDEAIQRAKDELAQKVRESTDPELKRALQVALAFTEGFRSPFDPPEYPEEPLALRAWRTVERLRQEAGLEVPEKYTRYHRLNEESDPMVAFLEALKHLTRK